MKQRASNRLCFDFNKEEKQMIKKMLAVTVLGMQLTAFAGSEICSSVCEYSNDAIAKGSKHYCLAKDDCGKSYIPECGNTCFSHAVDDAIRLCEEQSDTPDSCEVVSPKGGSCSTDRDELVKKAAK
jgi:hypothetical protein